MPDKYHLRNDRESAIKKSVVREEYRTTPEIAHPSGEELRYRTHLIDSLQIKAPEKTGLFPEFVGLKVTGRSGNWMLCPLARLFKGERIT